MTLGEIMTDNDILRLSREAGFLHSALTYTEKIVFDASFRPYCEEDLCGLYGKNYTCPPSSGTPEQMEARVRAYKRALVVSSEWHIEDLSLQNEIDSAREWHNSAMLCLIGKFKREGLDGLMIGAGACTLCKPCRLTLGKPCASPDIRYSCMAAYCIHVKLLADECNMNYDYTDGILPFFGLYVFN